MSPLISEEALTRRSFWVEEIKKISGNFGDDVSRLLLELSNELQQWGTQSLIDHLRLCGNIPESYGHDSSEEKLYSKYTDCLLAEAFKLLGMRSIVLTERADAADVEVYSPDYSFVADAKAFRLSRTAKNQKDFKIGSMDSWKRGKPFAMVVCPIHQLPLKTSQIYEQATSKNVCVFTYSHLALLVFLALNEGTDFAQALLHKVFDVIPALNPSKDAVAYWLGVNKTMLSFSTTVEGYWRDEKVAALESVAVAKEEALFHLSFERNRIMQMNHEQALLELVKVHKIENRIQTIRSVKNSTLLDIR
jgi:HindIII restriction endonuclease